MIKLRWLIASVFALALAPQAAWAQPTDEDRAQARQLAIEGNDALERKDYTTAADKFGRADQLFHAPTLLLGLARAHVGKGQLVSALGEYQRIVREGVPAGAPQFQEAVDDAKKELAALEPRVPWLTINVVGPSSPVVTLNGVTIPPAGLGERRAINPGSHMIKASGEGFVAVERGFSIAEGANEKFALMLERDSGTAAPPPVAPEPDKGSSAGSSMKTIGVIALVVGGLGLVAGGVTGGLALNEHGVLVDECPKNKCKPERQTTLDNFHALATISTIGFIVGGVGVAGGVTLLVLAPPSKGAKDAAGPKKASITPYIGVGEIGAVGRF